MSWKGVGEKLAKSLPVLGTLLAGPVGGAAGSLVAGWLGVEATPQAVDAALQDPGAIERLRTLTAQNAHEIEKLLIQSANEQVKQTNETYRAELQSQDEYVRRARPGFIYALKWTWILQVGITFATAAVAILADSFGDQVDAGLVVKSLAELNADTTLLWGPALAVIGIYDVQRSRDKAVAAGATPPSLLDIFRRK